MQDPKKVFVTVVVPVYNVEKYIGRCIESILSQTHTNFELILVDDGSPDNSGVICDAFAKKDNRITVIHQENGGVSKARNVGLDLAKGKYLFFVDSDDWIEPNHIECMLPCCGEDMVYGGLKFYKNSQFIKNHSIPNVIVERDEWLKGYDTIHSRGLTITFISGCYNMDIIRNNNLRFDVTLDISEDGLFNLEYMKRCQKIRYSDICTYCYEDGDDSSTSLSHKYQPKRLQAEEIKCLKTEEVTGLKEYSIRWFLWNGAILHYRKWLSFNSGEHREEAKIKLKEAYASPYFRECIPYIRRHGSLDQRIESFFMQSWLHPMFKPIYSIVILLSNTKRFLFKRNNHGIK